MQAISHGLPATLHTTPPSPLEAAFAQSGIDLPTPYLALSAQVIRDLPLENVAALQRFEALAKSELAALCAMIHAGLELRYADPAKAQLLAEGKDTGTTHIFDGEFDITVEVDKTVKWDQKQLATIFERIAANGDKPGQYIDLKYAVSEAKFKAWPETLRQPFEAARTVTPGKPKFTLRGTGEGK